MFKKMRFSFVTLVTFVCVLILFSSQSLVQSHDEPNARPHHIDVPANPTAIMRAFTQGKLDDGISVQNLPALSQSACTNGLAATYPCDNVDLMSFTPLAEIGGTQSNDEANDIWGWTDQTTGREYAIIGRVFGTSFVDITNPIDPVFIGELDTHGRFGSPWRDIKVYNNHAFIVSEARRHGMQVFDLTQLANVTNPPVLFQETAHYKGFGSAHNIVINEDSGYAYGVGTDQCSGGLEMVNIQNPTRPTDAGCYDLDGYTHDAQCVIYTGPDSEHEGKEICFASNEDTLTIVDVTDKSVPLMLSRTGYAGYAYTHQGWLTEDQHYFLLDDELDEQNSGHMTRTRVWDVSDLDNPTLNRYFDGSTFAIDHNQYIRGNCSFQANYRAGLRILKFAVQNSTFNISESGYFDIYPDDDAAQFNAAWSNYPYFDSGNIIISGIEQGLYVVRPSDSLMAECGLTNTNTSPTVTITDPVDGSTVMGQVDLAASAIDDEDAVGTLTVEWRIDEGSWNPTSYNETSTLYVAIWDTTSLTDSQYTLTFRAIDSGGKSSTDSVSVITDNGNMATSMHMESLTGEAATAKGGKWNATITAIVYDSSESPQPNATVTGSWSQGATGSNSCITDAQGTCTITKNNIRRNSSSATFTVNSVTHPIAIYDATANHDNTDIVTISNPN